MAFEKGQTIRLNRTRDTTGVIVEPVKGFPGVWKVRSNRNKTVVWTLAEREMEVVENGQGT